MLPCVLHFYCWDLQRVVIIINPGVKSDIGQTTLLNEIPWFRPFKGLSSIGCLFKQ